MFFVFFFFLSPSTLDNSINHDDFVEEIRRWVTDGVWGGFEWDERVPFWVKSRRLILPR